MNKMLKIAIVTLILSTVAMLWGVSYRNSHVTSGFDGDASLYALTEWVLDLGTASFLAGIGFLIAGIIKSPDEKPPV